MFQQQDQDNQWQQNQWQARDTEKVPTMTRKAACRLQGSAMTKECIFSKFTNKSSDCVAELLLWPQGLPFSLLSLIFLIWPFRPQDGILPSYLASYSTVNFIHSFSLHQLSFPCSFPPLLICNFTFENHLVQVLLYLHRHYTVCVQSCNSSLRLRTKLECRVL